MKSCHNTERESHDAYSCTCSTQVRSFPLDDVLQIPEIQVQVQPVQTAGGTDNQAVYLRAAGVRDALREAVRFEVWVTDSALVSTSSSRTRVSTGATETG